MKTVGTRPRDEFDELDTWRNTSGRDVFVNLPERVLFPPGAEGRVLRAYRQTVLDQCGRDKYGRPNLTLVEES